MIAVWYNYNGAIQTPEFTNVRKVVAATFSTFLIFEDDTVKCFGRNRYGRLGVGHTVESAEIQTPVFSDVKDIFLFESFGFALLRDGSLRSFGLNNYGQLGMGNKTDYAGVVQTPDFPKAKNVACGYYHTLIHFE